MVNEGHDSSFDDTPIITRIKQFSPLLEEHFLKFQHESRDFIESSKQQQTKPKFPYLRKGKGLQRYYKDPDQINILNAPASSHKTLPRKKTGNFGVPNRQNFKLKPLVQKNESCRKICNSKNNRDLDIPVTGPFRNNSSLDPPITGSLKQNSCSGSKSNQLVIVEHVDTWRNILEPKNDPHALQEKTAHSELSNDETSEVNRTLQENQELQAFELLEQHVANSSFSSSSSVVAALMERTVKSTPKKSAPPDNSRNHIGPLKGKADVHKQYVQNYMDYVSLYSKYESLPKLTETENNKFGTEFGQSHRMVDSVVPEEKSLHVHFEDEDRNEDSVLEDDESEDNDSEKLDFKDESTWSNCSCSSSCSENTQVEKGQQNTVRSVRILPSESNINPTIDYSKYPPMSVKTLKGILSPTKKPPDVLKIVRSTTSKKPSESSERAKINSSNITTQTDGNDVIFKSELLTSRLQDLENEMEIFQKANIELAKMKKEHEDDVRKFMKEKKAQEKKILEEEERLKSMIEEERRKLGKERLVLQKHSRSLKNQPTKEEREEIQALKQQLAELQNEMHKKESRWTAFQVRSRDRTKCLEQENVKLKQEIKELKDKKQKQLKLYETNRQRVENPTRIMNYINKQLGLLSTLSSTKSINNGNSKQISKYRDKKTAIVDLLSGEKPSSGGKKKASEEKAASIDKPSFGTFTETVFPNGDIEQKFENGRVKFYYASTNVLQITEVNGTEVYEFPNGQIEYHYTDGSKKVAFVDGSIKLIYTSGQEEWVLPDNTRWTIGSHGEKVVTLPNGDKEISTEEYLRREYSDGTVRILFPDGRIETRYPNGRLRVKNAEGQLILDLMETK